MSEKKEITSWRGRSVRLKPEFFEEIEEFDGYWDDNDKWIVDESMPKVTFVEINCPLRGFIGDPANEVFTVASDIYGIDLYRSINAPLDVSSVEPTHQVILKGKAMDNYPFVWEAKYFEVVKEERVTTSTWVKDEEF